MLKFNLLGIGLLIFCAFGCKEQNNGVILSAAQNAGWVNPFICTASDHGQTDVAATVPFGMVKPGPDTHPIAHSGYDFSAKEIIGFSNTRFSGVGCRGVGGNLRMLPFLSPKHDSMPNSATFSKNSEIAEPGYYSVQLDGGIKVELTASRQVALHQYTFPKSENAGIEIDLASSFVGHISEEHSILDSGIITGKVSSVNVCKKGQYSFYYAIGISKENPRIEDGDSKLTLSFPTKSNEIVQVHCALSVVSAENAQNNLKTVSNGSFENTRTLAYAEWNALLDVISVETKDDTLKELFYTHLYHIAQTPFVINDEDRTYRGSDGKLYDSETPYYHGWSIWDTFRTKLPLMALLYPKTYKNMMGSLKKLYKQGKVDWATDTEPFLTIRTEHAIVVLLEAYKKGLLPFSLEDIYQEMKAEAKNLPFKSPDNVLESSFDLWALSEIASILGHAEDAKTYRSRAFEYKTVWQEKFLVMDENSDIMHGDGLYEGTLWQYRWFVPFDIDGIQELMGGKLVFEEQLDYFFDNELFNIGNQPDIQVPYLYAYTNAPWKTQERIHKLLNTKTNNWYGTHTKFDEPIHKKIFTNTPEGYIREMDDDAGTMSAWYVWSAMGLYPLFPGSTQLALTTPQFDKITIKTSDKPLRIIAKNRSSENIYIQSATWEGTEINNGIINFNMISNGGTLQFKLGSKPNKTWGKNE